MIIKSSTFQGDWGKWWNDKLKLANNNSGSSRTDPKIENKSNGLESYQAWNIETMTDNSQSDEGIVSFSQFDVQIPMSNVQCPGTSAVMTIQCEM